MNIFGFTWLNSKERAELKRLKEKQSTPALASETATATKGYEKAYNRLEYEETLQKPFKNIYFNNDVVTVVFSSGVVVSREGATSEFVKELALSKTEDQIYGALALLGYKGDKIPEDDNTKAEQSLVEHNLDALSGHPEFIISGTDVFLKNVGLALPPIVASAFIQAIEKGETDVYNALKMFWLWTSLNPIESSRNDLLNFVRVNDIKITKNGLLQMYRRVVHSGNKNKALTEFVSNQYTKIKKWKKSAKNYWVWGADDGKLELRDFGGTNGIETNFGNLEVLYLDLPNLAENVYTDSHTHRKVIKVGQIYQEDEDKIDLDNTQACSSGLHVGALGFGFDGFGDTGVLALVNPMKVRSVPKSQTKKMRVSEMFIAGVMELGEYQKLIEDENIDDYSQEYFNASVEELTGMVKDRKFDGISCQDNLPALSLSDISKVEAELKSRVKSI